MTADVLRVDRDSPDPAAIARAADVLRRGGLVAFPTETVYGLGALALHPEAVARIFAAKGRPGYNPLIVHLTDIVAAEQLAAEFPANARRLAGAFWPGPLTLVVASLPIIPEIVRAGLPSVGLRIPAHPVALALLHAVGAPIAAPSANQFMRVSPTRAQHVVDQLGDVVDLVLDAGPCAVGIESTVVDVRDDPAVLLRPGMISRADLERVVGPVVAASEISGTAPRPSPGMIERHYSPRASLHAFDATSRSQAQTQGSAMAQAGERVRVIVRHAMLGFGDDVRALPDDAMGYAARLYDELNALDCDGVTVAFIQLVPDSDEWHAVRDRLARAGLRPITNLMGF